MKKTFFFSLFFSFFFAHQNMVAAAPPFVFPRRRLLYERFLLPQFFLVFFCCKKLVHPLVIPSACCGRNIYLAFRLHFLNFTYKTFVILGFKLKNLDILGLILEA